MTIKHLMAATALTLTLGVAPALAQTADPAAPGTAPAEQNMDQGASGSMDASPNGGGMDPAPESGAMDSTAPADSGTASDTTTPPDSGTASDTTTPPDSGTASDTTTPPDSGTASDTTEPATGDTASDTPEAAGDMASEAAAGDGTIEFVEMQEDGQWLADDYIGTAVRNAADENLGNINDLLVNEDGSVEAAIVGVGGFLGIGEKNVAVNFDAITENVLEDGSIELSMEADREALENAPAFVTMEEQNDEATAASGAGGGMTTGSTPGGGMGGGMSSPPPAAPAPQ